VAEKVFLNDGLVDIDRACISVRDSGFLYGAGVFETMRSHNGVVFALKDHLDRLFFTTASLSIDLSYSRQYITDAIYQVLSANELSDARVRLTISSGPMSEAQGRQSTLLVTARELVPYPPQYYQKGVMVVLCPYRQNPSDPLSGHKVTSYFARMLALKQAHERRAAEALWFTVDNRLAEGCISNVFLVKHGKLYTPPVRTPVLAGVARKAVCQLAVEQSIELVEKDLHINDLLEAEEIFLTNVIMQVMPVISVERHTVGEGTVGPVTKKLQAGFRELVEKQCGKKEPGANEG